MNVKVQPNQLNLQRAWLPQAVTKYATMINEKKTTRGETKKTNKTRICNIKTCEWKHVMR